LRRAEREREERHGRRGERRGEGDIELMENMTCNCIIMLLSSPPPPYHYYLPSLYLIVHLYINKERKK